MSLRRGPSVARPDVLLVVVDTLRADHLSLYGYERPTSPNLDRLGADAWVFERTFTVMRHTLPAHVSRMTGLHPGTHGVLANGWRYEGDAPTIAERLRRAGYRTAAFVSGLPVNGSSGLARGFDVHPDTTTDRGASPARVSTERTTARVLDWLRSTGGSPFFVFVHYFDTHLRRIGSPTIRRRRSRWTTSSGR